MKPYLNNDIDKISYIAPLMAGYVTETNGGVIYVSSTG